MKKYLNLIAAATLCVTLAPSVYAHRKVSPQEAMASAYMESKTASPIYRFPTRTPSSGLLDFNRALQSTSMTPVKAPLKAPEDINLLGYVPSAAGSYYGYIQSVPYREGSNFSPVSTSFVYNTWGGVEVNGTYYTVYQMAISPTAAYNYLCAYNTTTWFSTKMTSLSDFALFSTALAKDPTTDEVYGCFFSAERDKYEFGIADFENATRTTISEIDPQKPWAGCAIDNSGKLFAVDVSGDLYAVDKTTGATTLIGSTGVTTKYLAGMCYDIKGNRILRAVCNDDDAGLYQVDPATAECSLLADFPNKDEVMGLFIGAPLADDAAPEVPADVKADFPEGSLTGKVSFTVPAVTFGGAAAEGEVDWQVYGYYQVLASGKAEYGETVEADITAPYAGQTTFQITLSNEAGPSPKASVSCFIGKGTPAIPIPYVTYADGVATLTWEPVTTAVDAGYINPDEITYSITRWPDNVKVAEHISETIFSDPIPEPEGLMSYHYTVVAEYGDKISGYGTTVQIVVGSQGVPYINDFSSYNSLQFCTVIDVNEDNATWIFGAGGATVVSYTGDVAMDDWLITPGISLEAGHSYYAEITLRSLQMQGEPANIEIKHGSAATPEGLTETIAPLAAITELTAKPVSAIFRAEADGPHYIGVHAVAEMSNWAQVQKIVLKDAAMPDSVQNLTITAQAYPAVAADLKFDAPQKTAAGEPLESISKIEIIRGGVVVKTFENVAPGETIEWEDVIGNSSWASGNYMWTIVPYNEIGDGLPVTRIEYVGLAAPGMPETVSAVEDGDTGLVTLSWSPVDYDVNGRPLDAQYIHYRILNGGDYIDNDPDVEGNTYTYQVAKDGEQKFAMMGVQLYNERASSVAFTPAMPVGKPYSVYNESFVGGTPAHDMAAFDSQNYGLWTAVADGYYEGYVSADNDSGFLCLTGESVGTAASVCFGKFNLAGMERPTFSFSLMNVWDGIAEHLNENYVDILVDAGEGYEKIATVSCDIHDSCDAGLYAKQSVDLSRFTDAGNIRIALRGTLVNYVIIAVDKIKVAPALDYNLTLADLNVPSSARPGNELRINAFIENNGLKTAEGYTVTLYRDGEEVATLDGDDIAPDAVKSIRFTDKVSPLSASEISYTATVNYAADLDKSDNTTAAPSVVNVMLPKYPAPENLSAQSGDEGIVSLTWDEPSATMEADPVTESFEDGTANAVDNYGDWTFVDKDGAMSSYETKMAFMVYEPDPMILSYSPGLAPHTGNRYLSTWSNSDAPNDDWAISPELSGSAQTVSFYARSLYIEDGGEAFRFLYSTGSLDPEDFVEVEAVSAVPAEWTLYTFNIPDGARYFAINCVSQYQYTFMVDDVTYIPVGAGGNLSLAGYNIYRDGKAVNDAAVEDNAFTDEPGADGEYTYVVTALYDAGESVGSNAAVVTVKKSGIAGVVLSNASVSTRKGEIIVTGAEGLEVAVVAIDGKTIVSERGSAENVFAVSPGCYLVRIGRAAVKVVVK